MKNSQEIRFIDSEYKTLFTLPNGGFIKLLAEYLHLYRWWDECL